MTLNELELLVRVLKNEHKDLEEYNTALKILAREINLKNIDPRMREDREEVR